MKKVKAVGVKVRRRCWLRYKADIPPLSCPGFNLASAGRLRRYDVPLSLLLHRQLEGFLQDHFSLYNRQQVVEIPALIPFRVNGYVNLTLVPPPVLRGCPLHFPADASAPAANLAVEFMLGTGARDSAVEYHLPNVGIGIGIGIWLALVKQLRTERQAEISPSSAMTN